MKPASFTDEELFRHANPLGVTRVVLIQMSFYGFDNSYMLDAIARHQKRVPGGALRGVAVIDHRAARPQDEMDRLAERGVRGFRIQPGTARPDQWLAEPGMHAMWRHGARRRLAMCHLINPEFLDSVDKMCDKHADTPVVIDHFARVGINGPIREEQLAALCRLARHKQTYVKVSAFYALGAGRAPYTDLVPMIRRVFDAFGPQRLMWATDCPFQVQNRHTYADSLALVRDRLDFLSNEDRQWLLRKTAERVFFS
jgi:predicted TIM-barrel fold metal-dependent hydrolase